MKRKQTVSVGIVTRSRYKELRSLLSDLALQTHIPDQVIVVENAYDRQCINYGQIRKILPKSCSIKYVKISLQTMAPAYSRNICLDSVSSDILMFLDDDVSVGENYIEETLRWFNKFPGVLAVVPKIISTTSDVWSRFTEIFFSVGQWKLTRPTRRDSFPTCACTLDFATLKRTKTRFDQSLKGGEDYLFSKMALSKTIKKCIYIPDLSVYHTFSIGNPFFDFIKRFNWYSRSAPTLKMKYPKLLKEDLRYVNDFVPQRKVHLLLFPFFLLSKLFSEIKSTYNRYHLAPDLIVPNIIFNILSVYNLYNDENYHIYLRPFLKKIFRQKPIIFSST